MKDWIADFCAKRKFYTGGDTEYSSEEIEVMLKRFEHINVGTIDNVIKKDGVGRLIRSWVSKNDELCIQNKELCIKNKELCIVTVCILKN